MADSFTTGWLINVYHHESSVAKRSYSARVHVSATETPPGFVGAKVNTHTWGLILSEMEKKFAWLDAIEMNDPEINLLIDPKNGFNKRDYLADLRTMPLGHSKIIGDEYPSNTLDRKLLLVSNGYETNIEILESEVALTIVERTKGLKLHPFEVDVQLELLS